jgi:hypothetical protein
VVLLFDGYTPEMTKIGPNGHTFFNMLLFDETARVLLARLALQLREANARGLGIAEGRCCPLRSGHRDESAEAIHSHLRMLPASGSFG